MSPNANQGEIKLALAEYLRQDESIDLEERKKIRTVTGWKDDTITEGSCDTCSHDQAVVRVFYNTWGGEGREHVIMDAFSYLITDLTDLVIGYGE